MGPTLRSSNLTRWGVAALCSIALSLPVGVGLAPSAYAAGPTHKCGNLKSGGHTYAKKVTAKNISCKAAKRQILRYFLPGMDLDGYKCKGYPRQTCKKGTKVIAFTYPDTGGALS